MLIVKSIPVRSGMAAASAVTLVLIGAAPASAEGFVENLNRCATKNANTHDPAVVMLECTADAGKLAGCKVVDASPAGKGFDKAALCLADTLPMGGKSGLVRVPLRFPGSN